VTVLVTGAGGLLGRLVADALAARGVPVRGLGRGHAPAGFPGEWRRADVLTGEGVGQAAATVSVAVHCATDPRRPDGEARMLDALVEAMRPVGGHVVLVGVAGIEEAAAVLPYYQAKLACEDRLAAGGLPHTICRATQFYLFLDRVLGRLGVGPVQLSPPMRLQPVDPRFVAERLVDHAVARPLGRAPDLRGPDTLVTTDIVRSWLRARSRRRLRLPLPPVGALSAWNRLHPVSGETGGPGWAAWLAATYPTQPGCAF